MVIIPGLERPALAKLRQNHITDLAHFREYTCKDIWQLLYDHTTRHDGRPFEMLCDTLQAQGVSFKDVAITQLAWRHPEDIIPLGTTKTVANLLLRHGILGPPLLLALSLKEIRELQDVGRRRLAQIKAFRATFMA